METWILIIWISSRWGEAISVSPYFSSQQSCEVALKTVIEKKKRDVQGFCVKK